MKEKSTSEIEAEFCNYVEIHVEPKCGRDAYDRIGEYNSLLMDRVRKESALKAKKKIISEIPHTWLDTLFKEYLGQSTFTPVEVETMFLKVINKLTDEHLHPISDNSTKKADVIRLSQGACLK